MIIGDFEDIPSPIFMRRLLLVEINSAGGMGESEAFIEIKQGLNLLRIAVFGEFDLFDVSGRRFTTLSYLR